MPLSQNAMQMYQSEMEIMMDNPFGFGNPRCVYNCCVWFIADSLSSAEIILWSNKDVFRESRGFILILSFFHLSSTGILSFCKLKNKGYTCICYWFWHFKLIYDSYSLFFE